MNRHWLNKRWLNTGLAASFAFSFLGFFGLDSSTQEYGSLSGALRRTVAQAMPPYRETKTQVETGPLPDASVPAQPNPPASSEATPRVQ
jgi:hypothetical protein